MSNRMIFTILAAFGIGVGSISGECSPKFASDPRYSVCDTLAAKGPNERLVCYVSIYATSADLADPAHSENIRSATIDLFSKYDFRGWPDSTYRLPIPGDTSFYSEYGPYYILRSSIDSIVSEPYVQQLWFQESMPTLRIARPKSRIQIQPGTFSVDAKGAQVGVSANRQPRYSIPFDKR